MEFLVGVFFVLFLVIILIIWVIFIFLLIRTSLFWIFLWFMFSTSSYHFRKVTWLGIDRYGSSRYRYRYRYMFLADISADTDTDIFGHIYRPPIPIPIFSLSRYLADIQSKGRYMPIFWPISWIFNRYLADTDIADIYLTDTDTDIPIPISGLPIPIYRYRYRYRPNISANRYIGLSLGDIDIDFPLTMRLTKAIWLSFSIEFH